MGREAKEGRVTRRDLFFYLSIIITSNFEGKGTREEEKILTTLQKFNYSFTLENEYKILLHYHSPIA
jgi:hypothetical protein